MSDEFSTAVVTGDEWLDRIARLRVEVWIAEGMTAPGCFPEGRCLEEEDQAAFHFVIESADRLVAAGRYTQYPDLTSTHHGSYYQATGFSLDGPIGIPERVVVIPEMVGQGLFRRVADALMLQAKQQGARYTLSECSPAAAASLVRAGRKSLGKAPPDPRFPGVEFEWILSDVKTASAGIEGQQNNLSDP
ncbi:MAG: GNAT family N-acetyltransferase [Proteobacteria bacterium]|nr:GNAT family N-acetyltransferase [Pseudomonadota bacterium]